MATDHKAGDGVAGRREPSKTHQKAPTGWQDMFAVFLDGEVVGAVQDEEENEPGYRHAGIGLFLTTDQHGQGLGVDTVRTLALWLTGTRGHQRLTIDPAADNAAAIRCYQKVGFRPVSVLRAYWRDVATDTWRDGLLMDLLASELIPAPAPASRPTPTPTL